MHAIVLAAGKGTRMWPLGTRTPKPMMAIAGRSLLHRMLDALAAAGCTSITVVVPPGRDPVRRHAQAWRGQARLRCVAQGEPLGTGHAVAAAAQAVREDAVVVMADALLEVADLQRLVRGKGFLLLGAEVPDGSRYGVLAVKGQRLVSLREKPASAGRAIVNTGAYRVPVEALRATRDIRPSGRGELEFTDVVRSWARKGQVRVLRTKAWLDVGAPWDLLAACERLVPAVLDVVSDRGPGTIEEGVHVRGRIWVGEGAVVRSGTYVEGDVVVGPGSRVGPNAYLRGPVSIGAGCHVGAACEVKASVLLDGASAPHLNYVGDSLLGEGCNLGAGTALANLRHDGASVRVAHRGRTVDTGRRKLGAIVGDGAKTGVNCSLDPGTILGAGARVRAGAAVRGAVPDGALVP